MASKVTIKARVILYNRGKILLLKQTKPNGGNYSLVGGNIKPGENIKCALAREAFEEAGIQLKDDDLELVHVLQKQRSKKSQITFYFKCLKWDGVIFNREPHKFSSAYWFDLDQLPQNLTGTVRHVLEQYRHGINYSEIDQGEVAESLAFEASNG